MPGRHNAGRSEWALPAKKRRNTVWLQETTADERKTLFAAFAGYAVDAFDYMIYTFLIPTLIAVWGMTKADAGYIATAALLTSAAGGWLAGVLADKFGRVRMLQITVLWFSLFTFLSGFTNSFEELLFTRAMQGIGFGGEWSVGSVLISEMIHARHRGKAAGLVQSSWAIGWAVAAIAFWAVYSLVPPNEAWRVLFWMGVLPALLILYIRRNIRDPEVYQATRATIKSGAATSNFLEIFSPRLLSTTIRASLLATGMQGGYYAVTTWLPTFLKTERQLSVLGTSSYLLVLISGSFLGYLTSAYLNDRLGRRFCFILFAICAGGLAVAYTQIPVTDDLMLILGFPLGFFLSGIFSGMGAFLSELFPSRVRGSGQGFCYNFGRAVGSVCPALVGYLSQTIPLGIAIGYLAGGAYVLVVVSAFSLPETRGRELTAEEDAPSTSDGLLASSQTVAS
jgi:MFS family permease